MQVFVLILIGLVLFNIESIDAGNIIQRFKDDAFPNFRIFQIKDIAVTRIMLKTSFKNSHRFKSYMHSNS